MTKITLKPSNVPTTEGYYIHGNEMGASLVHITDDGDGELIALSDAGDSYMFAVWKGYWSDVLTVKIDKKL
jgi:hypothetical protein